MECQGNSGLAGSLPPETDRKSVFFNIFFKINTSSCGYREKGMYMYNYMPEDWRWQLLAKISSEGHRFC